MIFENGNLRLKKCRHGYMLYHVNDTFVGNSLEAYGEFSAGETELFDKIVQPGWTVVDVGANIGAHTIYFSQKVGPDGLVMAFEPQIELLKILSGNLALNRCTNAYPYHLGLSDREGVMHAPASDYSRGGNFGGGQLKATDGSPVRIRNLDSFNLGACDFIKIDVEGMELDVLRGAVATLRLHDPVLYVENDRDEKSSELIDWLLKFGYKLFWHLPPLFTQGNFSGTPINIFPDLVSINMLCVPLSRNPLVLGDGLMPIEDPSSYWREALPRRPKP